MKRILPFILLVLSSCSIQKRHFNKGYDIQWKSSYASSSNAYSEAEPVIAEPCDTIKNKDGSVVLAIVERIDSKKIYVSPCENSTSTQHEIDRSTVSTIHYANGALFENKTPEQLQKEREENLEKYRTDQEAYEKELIQKEQQRLAAENAALKAQNESLKKENSDLKSNSTTSETDNDPTITSDQRSLEPVMKIFFTIAFIVAGITIALMLIPEAGIAALLVLLIVDILSPFFTLYSFLKIKDFPEKFKGRPILRELILFFLSIGAVALAILQF